MDPRREHWELLNESEKEFLRPLCNIHAEVTARYQFVSEKQAKSKAVNDKLNADFCELCTEQGIDTKRAAAISTKLFNAPWYCYFVTDVQANNGNWDTVFSLCTHKHPDKAKALQPGKYKAFYDAEFSGEQNPDVFYPQILDGLHLPHDHKYISPTHYEVLATVAEVYTDQNSGVLIPRIGGRRIKSVDMPLDKPNNKMWNMLAETTGGQLKLAFATEKTGSKKEVSVLYSIDFDELKDTRITKALEPFDKRVYIALAALYNAGNEYVTIQQIYNAMGYDGVVGGPTRERINDSVTKVAAARVYMDNIQEVQAGYRYPQFQYDGQLLPMERVQAVINGQFVESVIHLLREPPVISFARGRKQITTVDRKLLATPVNKTNTNLAIEDYLITRIAKARTGKGQKRILYSTLYEEAHLTTSKQQQRAKPQIEKILTYYVKCNFISAFTMDKDAVTFTYDAAPKLPAKT